jgi:hypothetical protein
LRVLEGIASSLQGVRYWLFSAIHHQTSKRVVLSKPM